MVFAIVLFVETIEYTIKKGGSVQVPEWKVEGSDTIWTSSVDGYDETENLFLTLELKLLARKAYIERLDAGEKGATISFFNNTFPNPAGLIDFIKSQIIHFFFIYIFISFINLY